MNTNTETEVSKYVQKPSQCEARDKDELTQRISHREGRVGTSGSPWSMHAETTVF